MDLSSRGGTVALLGTLLVNSCFSLLLRHTERHNNDEDGDCDDDGDGDCDDAVMMMVMVLDQYYWWR